MLIERHGRGVSLQAEGADGDGPAGLGLVGKHIGRGWVRGFTITGGAIASTIGHDSHNVCVVGDNAADMMAAVGPWARAVTYWCATARSWRASRWRSAA